MDAKLLALVAALLTATLTGCGGPQVEVKGENGETVKMNAKGDMSVTNKDGKTTSVTHDGDKVTINGDKGTTTMEAKDGSMSVKSADGTMVMGKDKITEAELGLPFYPGSTSVNDQKLDQGAKSSLLSVRETKDDPTKVATFYKEKFKVEGNAGYNTDGTESATLTGKLADGRTVSVQVTKSKDAATTVTVVVAKE